MCNDRYPIATAFLVPHAPPPTGRAIHFDPPTAETTLDGVSERPDRQGS